MKGIVFKSSLAEWFAGFCSLKQASGAAFREQAQLLRRFDCFLACKQKSPSEVDGSILGDYLAHNAHLAPRTRTNLVCVVWPALAYAIQHGAPCPPLPPRPTFPRRPTRVPIILTEPELAKLLRAARRLSPVGSLRPHTYATFFGLLAVCGLRFAEARQLEIRDLDLPHRRLMIREGKFRKSRLLPIHASTADALERYLASRRRAGMPGGEQAHVFVNLNGRPLIHQNVHQAFCQLCRSMGLATPEGRCPSLHDLRHGFAVRTVVAWYRAGIDVNRRLRALSTYLGHVSVAKTLVYLQPHEATLSEAARRFEATSAPRLACFEKENTP